MRSSHPCSKPTRLWCSRPRLRGSSFPGPHGWGRGLGPPITQDPPHPPILTLQAPPFTQSLDESKALPFPKDLPRLPPFRPSALFLPPDYKHPGGQRSYLRFSKPQPWVMFLRREWKEERIPGASPPSPQPGLGVGQPNLGAWWVCGG